VLADSSPWKPTGYRVSCQRAPRDADTVRTQPGFKRSRLLSLSTFSDKLRRATVDTALFRNRFVAALAENIFVPYASSNSKTFELYRILISWKKPIYTLPNETNAALVDLGAQLIDSLVTSK